MTKKTARALALALAFGAPVALALNPVLARAQTMMQQPSGVLSLNAQASAEVPQDEVEITMFFEQQASEPSALTSTLNERGDAALQKARGVSGVTARSGAFSIFPSTDRDGRISTWRGRTEVVLESRDFAAASKLAGQMASIMQVGNVRFSLSPEAQRAAEQRLSTEAIKSFREQAASSAQAFGFSGYSIREVNVNHSGVMPRPMMMMSAHAMGADAKGAPMPLEAGTSTVTVNVSGSVQMK
jgi:predicted secreted protein